MGRLCRVVLHAGCLLLAAPAGIAAAAGADDNWAAGFVLDGVNGEVRAVAADGPNAIYVAGRFTIAGGTRADNIAKWNGATWEALGSGLSGAEVVVLALAVDSAHNLIVGGHFTGAGGVLAMNIAKWDPAAAAWSSFGILNNDVVALATDGTQVYAGGLFDTAGGVAAPAGLARWNGGSWSAVAGLDAPPSALAFSNGILYAGGAFVSAGGAPANHVAAWNGTTWSSVGAAAENGVDGAVAAIAVAGANVYVGGSFATAGTVPAANVASWDGGAWHALGAGVEAPVTSLVPGGGGLYLGGGFAGSVAHWDGATLQTPGAGLAGSVSALATAGGTLFAGGCDHAAGVRVGSVAQWDGARWSGVGANGSLDTAPSAIAVGPDNSVYVCGSFESAGGQTVGKIAKWTGSSWETLGTGVTGPDDFVGSLAFSGSDLYAAGSFASVSGVAALSIARWDGAAWSPLGGGLYGGSYGWVSALAIDGGNVYAAGSFHLADLAVPVNGLAKWNGSSWEDVGYGANGAVIALAVDADHNLYAAGDFTEVGDGVPARNIAKWNGSSWEALGAGLEHQTTGLFVDGTDVYAYGFFDPWPAGGLARWDGTSWSWFGGIDDVVWSMARAGGLLYVGGTFSPSTSPPGFQGVRRWNGSGWSALGGVGLQSAAESFGVNALAVGPDNALYAGGDFMLAGGKVSMNFAKWADAPPIVSDFTKEGGTALAFAPADFAAHLADTDGDELLKVRIVSLPATGQLTLDGLPVAAGQEIPAADLDGLLFTWDGVGSPTFAWNGADGAAWAAAPASVTIRLTPPLVTLTWPNGGQSLRQGSTYGITWTKDPAATGTVRLELLLDGVPARTIAAAAPNTGSFPWKVPFAQAPGNVHRVRISTDTPYSFEDRSDANVRIVPAITLAAPNGGQVWKRGTTQLIRWSSRNNPGTAVRLELYRNGVFDRTIVASAPIGAAGAGSYSWAIPPTLRPGATYTVKVRSATWPKVFDFSNKAFTITR